MIRFNEYFFRYSLEGFTVVRQAMFGCRIAELSRIIEPDSSAVPYFDSTAYCRSEIERLGLKRCADGYIARNGRAFLHEFSEPVQRPELSIQM